MPFTTEQFLDVFEAYNLALANIQWVFWVPTVAAIALVAWPLAWSRRAISLILGAMWLWTGIVYHLYFFSAINPAAFLFGTVFIVQGLIFLLWSGKPRFTMKFTPQSVFGAILLLYVLVIYPVLGEYLGHAYPRRPTFGTPCPTTIFTFGLLMFLDRKPPLYVYAIPFLWSLLGATAAYLFGIYEDLGLLAAGLLGSSLLFLKNNDQALIA